MADEIGDILEILTLRARVAELEQDNRDLIEGIDGMIQDREYFEGLANQERLCIGCQQEWRKQIKD